MKKLALGMAMIIAAGASCTQKPKGGEATAADSTSTIRINCLVKVTPETRDSVIALSKELVDSSLNDAGNIDYALYESATDSNSLIIFETWKDQASLDKHSASAHFTRLVPAIQKLSEMTIQIFNNGAATNDTLRLNCMVKVPTEVRDDVINLYKELVTATRTDDEGMIDYDLYLNSSDPTDMMVFETWKDQASLDKHSASPHFKRLVPQISEKAKSNVEKFNMTKE